MGLTLALLIENTDSPLRMSAISDCTDTFDYIPLIKQKKLVSVCRKSCCPEYNRQSNTRYLFPSLGVLPLQLLAQDTMSWEVLYELRYYCWLTLSPILSPNSSCSQAACPRSEAHVYVMVRFGTVRGKAWAHPDAQHRLWHVYPTVWFGRTPAAHQTPPSPTSQGLQGMSYG